MAWSSTPGTILGEMDTDPEQRLGAVGDVLPGGDQRAHLGEAAGALELAGAAGDGQLAHGGSHLVDPEEVERVAVLAALHHRRERHHLRRPVGGARHVHALRAAERLRAEVRPAREDVVDDGDGAEPEAEPVGAELHLRRRGALSRLQETSAGEAGVQRDAVVAVVRGDGAIGVGDRDAVLGRREADGPREGDLPVVDVAEQAGDGPSRRARAAEDVVHVQLQGLVRAARGGAYSTRDAATAILWVGGGDGGTCRRRGGYLRMGGGNVEHGDDKSGERNGWRFEARHLCLAGTRALVVRAQQLKSLRVCW